MDVETERGSAQLDEFIDRQAAKVKEDRAGQEAANRREAELKRADERHTAQLHQENAVLWREHFIRMAESHRKLSEDYERRAEEICEEGAA